MYSPKKLQEWEDLLVKAFLSVAHELIVELIERKLTAHGIKLSPGQKAALLNRLVNSRWKTLTLHFPRSKQHANLRLEITPEEVDEISGQLDRLTNSLPKLVPEIIADLTPGLVASLKRRWPSRARQEWRTEQAFRNRMARRWRGPLQLLSMLQKICFELGSEINAGLRSSANRARLFTTEVILRLHARACQITSEIIVLLSSGFADGALARWRSLHEISVTAAFVLEKGEPTAERYLLHDVVESRRTVFAALGKKPAVVKQFAKLERNYQTLIGQFGKAFGSDYGWSAEALGMKRPTFTDIERAVDSDYLRPYYRLASSNVHANPKGVLFRLGLFRQDEVLLAGPSNFGLADPGSLAAASLTHVTIMLAELRLTFATVLAMSALNSLTTEIWTSFAEVQNAIEQEEKAIARLRRQSQKGIGPGLKSPES